MAWVKIYQGYQIKVIFGKFLIISPAFFLFNFKLIVLRWSECSRSCGGGIRSSKRNCTNPTPQGGGLYCIGSRVRYESCNTWECPRGSQDPRLQQCQKFNGNNFKISGIPSDVQWVPKYTSSMRMFLYSSKSDVLYNVKLRANIKILNSYIFFSSSRFRPLQTLLPSSRFINLLSSWCFGGGWDSMWSRYI